MRTRTAPSDRPRTPAISAVLISSTNRSVSARRRSSGRARTARSASPASSRVTASASRSAAVRDRQSGARARPRARRRAAGGALRRSLATVLRAIRNSHTRNVRRLGAVLGARLLAEPRQGGERAQEHALGRVLRGVMVPELVEGVGIHLGEVLPIQGVEPGRGRAAPPPRAPGRDRARRPTPRSCAPAFQTPDRPSRYTRRRESDAGDLARVDVPLAARGGRVRDDEGTASPRRRRAPRPAAPPAGRSSVTLPAGRRLAVDPARRRRRSRRGAPRPRPSSRSRNPARSASRSIGRPPDASRRLVIVPASSGGKSAAAQSPLIPMPTTTRGSSVPEALALAEDAGELAQLERAPRAARRPPRASARRRAARAVPPVSITRSFGHLSRMAPTGRPAASSAASAIASATVAARRHARSGASHVGPEPERAGAARRPAARSTSGRGARGRRSARRRRRRRPPARRRRASRGRRRSCCRPARTARRG